MAMLIGSICSINAQYTSIRDLGEKIVNLYKNSGKAIEKYDLQLFLEDNSFASVQELIQFLEEYKLILHKDIMSLKTQKRPSFGLRVIPGIIAWIGGRAGINSEQEKSFSVQCEHWNANFDRDLALYHAKKRHLNCRYSEPDKYLTNGEFDQSKFDAEHPVVPEYVPYTMQNIWLYNLLIAGGVISTLFVAYKVYKYLMYPRDKRKEIALIDEIILQLSTMQLE